MMVGVPGSGKSFFAEQFAGTFNAPYIDSLILEEHSRDEQAAGALIGFVLGELTKTKSSFVFEGNSDSRVRRTEFAAWARNKGYVPLFIWVQVDMATALSRSVRSGSMNKDEFEQALRGFSAPHETEKAIVISGKHTYASQAKVVLKKLSEMNRPAVSVASAPRPAAVSPERRSVHIRS